MTLYQSPSDLLRYTLEAGETKAQRSFLSLLLLGFFGGMAIALGAVGNIVLTTPQSPADSLVLLKLLGAAVFPVGLMLIVFLGGELFTSNTMMLLGVIDRRFNTIALLRNWVIVWCANLLGASFVAWLTVSSHAISADMLITAHTIATKKTHTVAHAIFLKGILCNILVCAGVLMAYAAKDSAGRIFGIWFPIMLFIVLGYEHCVANMLYLPLSAIGGGDITITQISYNLLFATLGNIVGGAIILTLPLYIGIYRPTIKH